jgi:hypothetical protein
MASSVISESTDLSLRNTVCLFSTAHSWCDFTY